MPDTRSTGQPGDRLDERAVCIVAIGTRPEAIKMIPVIAALDASESLRPYVVLTGQHADLVKPLLERAGFAADAELGVARPGQTINDLISAVVRAFDELLQSLRGGPERRRRPRLGGATASSYPVFTLVHGDTTSALAVALASQCASLPVAHVEAGLRTYISRSPFPEEMNRQLIGRIASLHFAPTSTNAQNLIREAIDARTVFVTGNTALDAVKWAASQRVPWPDDRLSVIDDHSGPLIAVTAHRRESWGEGLKRIASAIAEIATRRPDLIVVLPLHPNPIVRSDLRPALEDLDNVILTEPLDYLPFARLLAASTLVITDSGGIQEEAPTLGTPVLVTRTVSERQEGVEAGTLRLVGTEPRMIVETAMTLLDDPAQRDAMISAANPFGDGNAAARTCAALEHVVTGSPRPEAFGGAFSRDAVMAVGGFDFDTLAPRR